MADDIILSSAVRSNLLSLQNTSYNIDTTQTRLSSGLRVSSPLDDAAAFFAATGLNNRASDLSDLKDNIDQSISAIEAAVNGLEAITELVEQDRKSVV